MNSQRKSRHIHSRLLSMKEIWSLERVFAIYVSEWVGGRVTVWTSFQDSEQEEIHSFDSHVSSHQRREGGQEGRYVGKSTFK